MARRFLVNTSNVIVLRLTPVAMSKKHRAAWFQKMLKSRFLRHWVDRAKRLSINFVLENNDSLSPQLVASTLNQPRVNKNARSKTPIYLPIGLYGHFGSQKTEFNLGKTDNQSHTKAVF